MTKFMETKGKYIYYRCSTEGQDFAQQNEVVTEYLRRHGISGDIPKIVEKVSGSVSHKERKLSELLDGCSKGDTIYISELSRLGRNMTDLFSIITEASKKGVTVIQCKDSTVIENESIGGKALLFALSLAAEIELNNIRQRTKAGLDARKSAGKEIGGTKALWGKNTGADRSDAIRKANEASARSRREKAMSNPDNRAFREFIEDWEQIHGRINANTDFRPIADKLNERGKTTVTGLPFTANRARAMYDKIRSLYA